VRFPKSAPPVVLAVALALAAAACSSGDDAGADSDDTTTTAAAEPELPDADLGVEAEIFSSDEGAGCVVYVSVPEDDASGDLRAVIWQGVVAQDFTDCGFSDVVEVGLITVNGLDSYNQPDFAQTVEHAYFAVDGWDALVSDCYSAELDDACRTLLQTSLTE